MSQHSSSLVDLILLNREIAALVRAGIPLELGLRGLSGSVGTRLGRLSERLSKRLASGQSLPEALAEEGPAVSPVYTAVMEAGLASGRLPEALTSMAASGEVLRETRQRVLLALLYPALCCAVGYLMFCLFLTVIAPQLIHAEEVFRFPASWPIDMLKFLYRHRLYATMVVPAFGFALLVVFVLLRRKIAIPGLEWSFHRSLNWAQFMELLALQLEQNSPLPRAFSLAAESTDDVRWQREAHMVTEQLTLGSTLAESLQSATRMPPLIRWMLATGEKQGTLAPTLRQLSEMYRRRALQQAATLKTWIPVVMTICVTGSIGLAYGLIFFIPMRALLTGLMNE